MYVQDYIFILNKPTQIWPENKDKEPIAYLKLFITDVILQTAIENTCKIVINPLTSSMNTKICRTLNKWGIKKIMALRFFHEVNCELLNVQGLIYKASRRNSCIFTYIFICADSVKCNTMLMWRHSNNEL